MINRVMRRLPFMCTSPQEAALEAFAYTYWSHYANEGAHARTMVSQQRAWDHDACQHIPRVNGGKPGYCVAKWKSEAVTKLVVAVEGMSSLSQLWQAWVGCNSSSAAPLDGNVFHSFKTYGDAIKAELLASAFFVDAWNERQCAITFTGMSFGAAIAEYLSFEFKRFSPSTRNACIKFASPRVGSNSWLSGNELPEHYRNYYLNDDPISVVPYMTMTNLSLMNIANTAGNTFYQGNGCAFHYDHTGRFITVRPNEGYDAFINAMVQCRRAVNENNPWLWHNLDRYRTALTGMARALGSEQEARFRYLEYNDHNNWGNAYVPGAMFDPSYKVNVTPDPASFVVEEDVFRDGTIVRQSLRNRAIQIVNPVEPRGVVPSSLGNPAWRPRATRNR